ncbi:hypothetical protein [Siphonobacter sp. SORGH_AS_0500]|uniref:hypothetical protein n=1 Tax=Siphonobacter sp. SORGH_AS_0500 TaxID=1864824 RepID=UPI00285F0580|nr:hypothetical protein [Siphonobacter sp. SORGH_AS_0500]MDR6195946.1 hypothetical protein [Siphonobacter sp. SORGH_AS_0500]
MQLSELTNFVQIGGVSLLTTPKLLEGKELVNTKVTSLQTRPSPLMDFQANELDFLIRVLNAIQQELDSRNPFLQ